MGLLSKIFPISEPLPRPPVPEGKTRLCVRFVASSVLLYPLLHDRTLTFPRSWMISFPMAHSTGGWIRPFSPYRTCSLHRRWDRQSIPRHIWNVFLFWYPRLSPPVFGFHQGGNQSIRRITSREPHVEPLLLDRNNVRRWIEERNDRHWWTGQAVRMDKVQVRCQGQQEYWIFVGLRRGRTTSKVGHYLFRQQNSWNGQYFCRRLRARANGKAASVW